MNDYTESNTIEDVINEQIERLEEERRHRRNEARYYKKQRTFGLFILFIGIAIIIVAKLVGYDFMSFFGMFVGTIGLYIMCTYQKIFINEYFIRCKDTINKSIYPIK